jgi:hypothetical protein
MPLKRVNKLGQVLLDEGLVTETDLRRALESQDKDNKRLGEVLMDMGILSPKAMLSALAKQLNVKAVQLRHGLIDPAVARLLDREEAARLKALPLFKVGDTLTVAMAEPQALPTIDRLGALTGCRINPVLALESNIAEFQEKYLGEQVDIDSFLVPLTESEGQGVERETIDEDTSHEISRMVDGSPIINLVNLAIMTAVRDGASDIHVEPTKQATRLRYRIDGNLRELMSAPNSMHARSFRASRSSAGWTSPSGACHRKAACMSSPRAARSTCASPPCRRCWARRSCCASSTSRTSMSRWTSSGGPPTSCRASAASSPSRTASCSSLARRAAARPPRSIRSSTCSRRPSATS